MFGSRMRAPAPGSEAEAREATVLADSGLKREEFSRHRLMEGTRRPIGVPLGDPTVEEIPSENALRLGFGLPAGAYATVVAAEITKNRDAGGTTADPLLHSGDSCT
jgi:tRNA(Glu) U13 pseudouridine synthase TruD